MIYSKIEDAMLVPESVNNTKAMANKAYLKAHHVVNKICTKTSLIIISQIDVNTQDTMLTRAVTFKKQNPEVFLPNYRWHLFTVSNRWLAKK